MSVRTLALVPGKTFAPNLKQFPVTAGAPYTLDTAIAATAAAEHAGYVTIVFIDAMGKGLGREFLWFSPSLQQLGKIQTDAHGAFRFPLPATVTFPEPEVRAEYSGSASQRPALGVLTSPLGAVNASLPALEPALFGKSSLLRMLAMRSDFWGMFTQESLSPGEKSQWDQVAGRIQVAYFSGGGILKMPEALARLVRDLKARHVGLGLEILATNWFHERPCGGAFKDSSTRDRQTRWLRSRSRLAPTSNRSAWTNLCGSVTSTEARMRAKVPFRNWLAASRSLLESIHPVRESCVQRRHWEKPRYHLLR